MSTGWRAGLRGIAAFVLAAAAVFIGAAPAAAAVANPPWPARCPQRVVIVLDLSTSIDPYLPQVTQAADDLVDALRGAPNEVGVVTFGSAATVAVPVTDVGAEAQRAQLKRQVDDVALLPGDGGGTNWEEALRTAAALRPDVVLLLTDGEPSVHGGQGTGYEGGGDSLTPAVRVADAMRSSGTRIVGVGIGLMPSSVPNLVQVTGPAAGDDYYRTDADTSGLLDRLYDVAGKTCGIPVAALPPPEGGSFPVLPAVIGAVAVLVLGVTGAYVVSRRRSGAQAVAGSGGGLVKRKAMLEDRSIRTEDVPAVPSTAEDAMTPDAPVPTTRRRPGRMSLDRLHLAMDAEQAAIDPSPPNPGVDHD